MTNRGKYKGKYPVPRNNKKACVARDGTYSISNWKKDDYWSQGIGQTEYVASDNIYESGIYEDGIYE